MSPKMELVYAFGSLVFGAATEKTSLDRLLWGQAGLVFNGMKTNNETVHNWLSSQGSMQRE